MVFILCVEFPGKLLLTNAKKWYPEWLSVVEHGIIMPVAVLNSALVSKKSNTISYFTVLGFVFDYQKIKNYRPLGPSSGTFKFILYGPIKLGNHRNEILI